MTMVITFSFFCRLGASVLQALENTRRKTTILNGATSSQEIQGNGN
jgi:hypothetical protein